MLYAVFFVQQSILERIAQVIQRDEYSWNAENGDAEETMALLH